MTPRHLNPGAMDRRVTIQRDIGGKDAVGSPAERWRAHATVWAKRENLPGREVWQAMQVTPKIPVRYVIWHLEGLTTAMRLVDGNQVFDIKSVAPEGMHMVLLCEEVV